MEVVGICSSETFASASKSTRHCNPLKTTNNILTATKQSNITAYFVRKLQGEKTIENIGVSGMIIQINSRKRGSEGVVLVQLSQKNFLSIRGFCGH
jgi:hypothetical protein